MRKITVGDFRPTPLMKEYVNEVLDSGRITYGKFSRAFERKFSNLHGCDFAVLSNSGTSSLHVALQTLKEIHGWEDGDEVIVPALTFVATANIVLHNRLTPVLVDIDPEYYAMDETQIEEVLSPKARCIIPVHPFGQPCNMFAISSIAKEYNLKVIEDSCESMFVNYKGKPVGSWGDIACFSTYAAHILTTGVGGIATTNNPDYALRMRSLVNHGRDNIYISIDDDGKYTEAIGKSRFHFEHIGHSFRITEMEAALGLGQLEIYKSIIRARQDRAHGLTELLKGFSDNLQLPAVRPEAEHAWMMYPIVSFDPYEKWGLVNFLEERGIETREMLPLINQPCYAGMFYQEDFPITMWVNEFGFYIGCHEHLTDEDLKYVGEVFDEWFGHRQSISEPAPIAGQRLLDAKARRLAGAFRARRKA